MSLETHSQASSKKRLVFFTASLEGGGAERVISIITKYLVINNYTLILHLLYSVVPYQNISFKFSFHNLFSS